MDFRLPESLIFLELCNPFSSSTPGSISEDSWSYISQLAQLHGVTPFVYYRTKTLGISLPPQVMEEWRRSYLVQIAKEVQARRQMKEIGEVLASQKIPIILLKGASAMLRLYPNPGLRTFCDLDVLIQDEMIFRFKQAMANAGYKPLSTLNSPEDEAVQKFDAHLDPFWKTGGLMIEPHLSVLRARGEHAVSLQEIWRDREGRETDGVVINHLDRKQFVVHALLHCATDLLGRGFAEIKGFIDVLYALRTCRTDWSKVWDIAGRWGIQRDILPVMTTLNQYWQADIPLREKATPLDLHTLMLGVEDQQKYYYEKTPTSCLSRLLKVNELPNAASRIRYLFRLLFPTRENLLWRYNPPPKGLIISYYFLHIAVTSRKLFMGLWYRALHSLSCKRIVRIY